MDSKISDIEKNILDFIAEVEADFSPDRLTKIKKRLDEYIKEIDANLESFPQENKMSKAKYFYLKGKLLDLLPEYSKQAEEALSKSLKLNPNNCDCWNILGNILWKKNDKNGAQRCFEGSLEQCGKNITALRNLSMVLRSIEETNQETKKKNVLKSIELAKTALTLDLKDGESWYVLGNAYMFNFFVNMTLMTELQNALKAYNQAEANSKKKNPDLHYNRANILSYLEDYDQAVEEYKKADALDPLLPAKKDLQIIKNNVIKSYNYIQSKGNLKAKKLTNLIKSIPSALKQPPKDLSSQINYEIYNLERLKVGMNKGKILSGKILASITEKGSVPAIFVFVDFKGDFGALSVFNTSNEIYEKIHEQADVFIVDPLVKEISLHDNDMIFMYKTLQIYEIDNLFVDNLQITPAFSPNIVVNENFQH